MYTVIPAVPTAILQNPENPTPLDLAREMVMLNIKHYDFQGNIKAGQIIVHQLVADQVLLFFTRAYNLQFSIHSVIPAHQFNWNDAASCFANNSSGHNMRYIEGTTRLSKHAIGCAFDINPVQNPCFVLNEKTLCLEHVIPVNGAYDLGCAGTLHKDHPLVMLMVEQGWSWGGNWTFPKDYQHFQIVPKELAMYVQ